MDMYPKYTSPFGYQTNDGKIDSYGVDHSGFSIRDEIEYQYAREKRENELKEQYKAQGITSNFPQFGTNFWGNSANNYGFGLTNIANNIANMKNNFSPIPQATSVSQNQGVPYAQNTLSQTVNNTTYNPNYISDDDLYQRMWNNIKKYEGISPYPYLDTGGNITVGGGTNINNYNDFMKVNFLQDNIYANSVQKDIGFNQLHDMSQHKDSKGNYLYANTKANFFEPMTNLRITNDEAYRLAQNHMKNDLAHVRSEFTDFDYFPNPLKEVLLDIHYNTGGLNKQNWPNLYNAINNRDINGIVNNVHRTNVGRERNDWAQDILRSIKF